ncbi:UxaA family hydrolase [Cohnella lupini]|uniref:Altronate dehydratase small subunit n=1 Tax=Cohnella lupini TaxID=1294267 RepID=A0A3D9IJT7_9BACL|nr:UxaA family hydrolase [Cohnella lupini]RED61789.1 altronate dehydratase small subunit [Cohnella lupini]
MSHEIARKSNAIVMNELDHVATALKDMKVGEEVRFHVGAEVREVRLSEAVAFGHKFAIVSIEAGEEVRKYGEVIGRSTEAIEEGSHVHVHNIEGIRGRGDQADKEEAN